MTVGKVFLNYRRDDSEGYVGRLYDHLTQRFPGRIFRDVTGLRPGEDFVNALDREGISCQVLLAIIGRRWLSSADAGGRRRLDDPEDILRREIIHALQRNVLVIPVLVGGATVPAIDDLPPELKPLGRRQALPISELDFERDLERLIEIVAQELSVVPQAGRHPVPPPPPPQPAAHKHKTWLWVLAAVLTTVVVLAIIGSVSNQNKTAPATGTTQETSTVSTENPAGQSGTGSGTEQSDASASQQTIAPSAPAAVVTAPAGSAPASVSTTSSSAAAAAWQKELISTSVAMTSSRQQMSTILSGSPRSLPELQYQARQLLTAVDGYDQQVDSFSALLSEGDSEGYFTTGTDRAQSAALQQVCQIRKQQAARYRYQSQLVLQYNPYTTQYAVLLSQLTSVQGEINALDAQAAGLMHQAGLQ